MKIREPDLSDTSAYVTWGSLGLLCLVLLVPFFISRVQHIAHNAREDSRTSWGQPFEAQITKRGQIAPREGVATKEVTVTFTGRFNEAQTATAILPLEEANKETLKMWQHANSQVFIPADLVGPHQLEADPYDDASSLVFWLGLGAVVLSLVLSAGVALCFVLLVQGVKRWLYGRLHRLDERPGGTCTSA